MWATHLCTHTHTLLMHNLRPSHLRLHSWMPLQTFSSTQLSSPLKHEPISWVWACLHKSSLGSYLSKPDNLDIAARLCGNSFKIPSRQRPCPYIYFLSWKNNLDWSQMYGLTPSTMRTRMTRDNLLPSSGQLGYYIHWCACVRASVLVWQRKTQRIEKIKT